MIKREDPYIPVSPAVPSQTDIHKFDIQGPLPLFHRALAVAMFDWVTNTPVKCPGYIEVDNGSRLLLLKSSHKDMQKFLLPLDQRKLGDILLDWLDRVPLGDKPIGEGTHEGGFRIRNDNYEMVDGISEAFASVETAWLYFGK